MSREPENPKEREERKVSEGDIYRYCIQGCHSGDSGVPSSVMNSTNAEAHSSSIIEVEE
jgi:hypothetical protein